VSFRDLGQHRLKDLPEPEHLFQVEAPGLDAEFPPLRTLDARKGNLPPQLTTFVGREHEIQEIGAALDRSRLVTLTGPGGTGKTRLSLQVARDVESRFPGGAYFVALAPLREAGLVAPAVVQALGLRQEPARSAIDTVIDHLRGERALLVLDNFEQVLDAAPDVAGLLDGAEGIRIIITSRESLRLQAEQEYPVPPLALPDPRHLPPLDALSHFEAVALFIERARAVKPGFSVTNDNAPAVAEICARLDGLPLAIELAAARVKVLSPEAVLGRLESRLTLLAGGARDLPARQQTLRGAIAWSYDLLDGEEQRFFARLSVFAGGCTLEAVETVCGPDLRFDALEGVASLVNKSLLRQAEQAEGRFFMLETIREFAAERLAELPDAADTHRRHAAYFLAIAEATASELFGPKQAELLDALEKEHDNFRAALTWSVENDLPTAFRLGGALWRFYQMRGYLREGAERLKAMIEQPGAEQDPAALAVVLEGAGGVAYWMGQWEDAERYYQRCLDIRRELGDPAAVAEALYNLSFVYTVSPEPHRDRPRGRQLNEEALEIFQGLEDRRGLAKALWAIAANAESGAEWELSHDAASRALTYFLEFEDRFGAGWAYHSIGLASSQLGRMDEARAALEKGMELFLGARDISGVGIFLQDMSLLEGLLGDHQRASRLRGAAYAAEELTGQGLTDNIESYIEGVEDAVRGPLPQEEYERLQQEGAAMTVDEAAAYALRRPDPA
jgi:predicted ATPase